MLRGSITTAVVAVWVKTARSMEARSRYGNIIYPMGWLEGQIHKQYNHNRDPQPAVQYFSPTHIPTHPDASRDTSRHGGDCQLARPRSRASITVLFSAALTISKPLVLLVPALGPRPPIDLSSLRCAERNVIFSIVPRLTRTKAALVLRPKVPPGRNSPAPGGLHSLFSTFYL
jgi:hypothetical protein